MPVVEATGIAVGRMGGEGRAQRIEKAMQEALEKAQADGITDADELREAMIAARDAVIADD